MSNTWFEVRSDGKTYLTEEGVRLVRVNLNSRKIRASEFPGQLGASRPAFYKWLQGLPMSARGRSAVEQLLLISGNREVRPLEEYSIEELVAALKAKGVKGIELKL